ncbi:MAG: LLM class flavin-dependent oxidoreductase, partial [Alphaproteobacteria bacterium]
PAPPVWMTGLSASTGRAAAERGHIAATLISGSIAKPMFEAYRTRANELGWEAGPDRLAYAAMIGVGRTSEEGRRRADQICGYVRTSPVVYEPFTNPPGYNTTPANVFGLKNPAKRAFVSDRQGNPVNHLTASIEDFMASDTAFAGTPDEVFEQIKSFHEWCGGFGNLLFFGQGGVLNHEDTCDNIRLFAEEVMPRLQELNKGAPVSVPRVAAAE